jgi:hypothetical protein
VRFLIDEKSREVLLGMCQRIARLADELPRDNNGIRLGRRVSEIAREIGGDRGASRAAGPIVAEPPPPTRTGPCEICGYVIDRCFEFLRKFQYEITVDPERQQQLAERGGLCSFHTWVYEQLASPQGTCMGYASVLDRWASRLSTLAAADRGPSSEATGSYPMCIPGPAHCLVCEAQGSAESMAVTSIAGRLRQSPDQALAALSEICLPHLRALVAVMGNGPVTARLIAQEAAMLRRMAEDMRRYALKHDGLRRYLASEEETNAAARALLVLAGHRALNMAPRR